MFFFRLLVSVLTVIFVSHSLQAQNSDSIRLSEVLVQGYLSSQPFLKSPASAVIIDYNLLQKGSQQSLLPVVNTAPGVRMEERSPGSYRFSIRGSLLRSPFGVRNIKIYLDELPLTDASGNTYLNLVDPELITRIELLKGPDGSLFGANSGGVALLSMQHDSSEVNGSMSGGSFGMFREKCVVSQTSGKMRWSIGQAFQRADGYREQSFLRRFSGFASGGFNYGPANNFNVLALYSDLHYETPGGLTLAQFKEEPQQARPAAGPNPGAVEQQTGVFNKTFFGGITNDWKISSYFNHVVSAFGTLTDFENPFITNYEIRSEKNGGLRTFLNYTWSNNKTNLQWNVGLEGQWGSQEIANYENIGGERGMLLASDKISVQQVFYFTSASFDIGNKFFAEAAVSLNQYQYEFKDIGSRNLSNQWMPRFALSYRIIPDLALRASISKGYSPPTIAEIRPSGAIINPDLEAEKGWSREMGVRIDSWKNRLQFDASVFRFDLNDAIVRRTDNNDVEYFLNSGGTKQIGVECLLHLWLLPIKDSGSLRGIEVSSSVTFSDFIFENYQVTDIDYSGNDLTGVPEKIFITGVTLWLPVRVKVFIQSNVTSRIPLNDANSEYAEQYHLLQGRLDWGMISTPKLSAGFFLGADNLLDQHYSLGNDINAFGGRYYNAAPIRNFYVGLHVKL